MKKIDTLKIEQVKVTDLHLHPHNARQGDVGAIIQSLESHGQYRPIVVQKSTMNVIAGNHTLMAASALGWKTVDATILDVDDDQALRILLVDNRANDLATYDKQVLTDLLESLAYSDFGLQGTGFIGDDLDEMLNEFTPELDKPVEPVDAPVISPPSNPITKRGDVWLLGSHRLICGDSRDADDVKRLMNGTKINVAFTSPPYAQQRTYDESSGFKPIPPDEYVEWYAAISENVKTHLASDGSYFINIKAMSDGLDTQTYVLELVLAHAKQWGWHFGTEFCWERTGMPGIPQRRFKNQFEPIYQFALNDWKFNPDAVRHASDSVPKYSRDSQWSKGLAQSQGSTGSGWADEPQEGLAYPGNRLNRYKSEALGHAAAFPVDLPGFFIKAYSDEGDAIYDPFMGSGSTIIAAHNNNRVGYGVELSPAYCDVICKRFQDTTAITPILESTGEAVSFVGFSDK